MWFVGSGTHNRWKCLWNQDAGDNLEDRSRHLIDLDVFVVRVQGVEVIRDAMLDMWEAELGADFTPKAGVAQKHHDKCQIWEALALLKGSSESGLWGCAPSQSFGFMQGTNWLVFSPQLLGWCICLLPAWAACPRPGSQRICTADGCWVSLDLRYASRIKIIHRSWREANKSVALPEEEEEKAPSRWWQIVTVKSQ